MPQFRYRACQPTKNVVHLTFVGATRFKFISIERLDFVENGGFPVKGRGDIIIIPVQQLITNKVIKDELSKLRGCSPDEIEIIEMDKDKTRASAISDAAERRYRRMMRYSHGLDPSLPPPGWIPD